MLNFFNTTNGKILISLIWGFGLATFFKKTCRGDRCIVINAPTPKDVENRVFSYQGMEGSCFKYKSNIAKCKNEENQTLSST